MNVVFFGGQKAGLVCLLALAAKEKIVQVFAEDKVVEEISLALGFETFKAKDLVKENLSGCDLLVCCHGKKILSKEVLSKPKIGCINLHPFLEDFKGLNPVGRWFDSNSKELSVGVYWMSEKVDCGEVICVKKALTKKSFRSVEEVYNELYSLYVLALLKALVLVKGVRKNEFKVLGRNHPC